MAFHLLCSSKKGFSALQLQRELSLGSYRTAWFMFHRIRHAMEVKSLGQANGRRCREWTKRMSAESHVTVTASQGEAGRGTSKAPVVALVERDGEYGLRPVERIDMNALWDAVQAHPSPNLTVITDELPSTAYSEEAWLATRRSATVERSTPAEGRWMA